MSYRIEVRKESKDQKSIPTKRNLLNKHMKKKSIQLGSESLVQLGKNYKSKKKKKV